MTDKSQSIIVFGKGGNWCEKNRSAIESRFDHPQFVGEENWQQAADNTAAPLALIMTPPHTHLEICQRLMANQKIQKIYCEKPFPDIESVFSYGDTSQKEDEKDRETRLNLKAAFQHKIRIIDHYLLKKTTATTPLLNITIGRAKVWRLAEYYLGRWYYLPFANTSELYLNNRDMSWIYEAPFHIVAYFYTAFFRVITYLTGWTPVKYIEIDIKEKDEETRNWMKDKNQYSGVVHDLGHHALAILIRLFGTKALNEVSGKDISIQKIKYFGEDLWSAISEITFLIKIKNCTIQISVAKDSVNNSKKMALFKNFMAHAKPNQEYSLNEGIKTDKESQMGYDYAENFNSSASCLTYDEAKVISKICNRVSDLAHHVKNREADVTLNEMDLINNLTDQFKHRHSFYWQSYYKLVIYQVIILLTPYAFAMNFIKGQADQPLLGPGIIIFGLTVAISLWIYYWGVQRVTAVLSEEHIRMKVVHDRLKDLLNKTKVNLSVISINESSISDVMQTQYRFLVRGFCVLNPIVIYFMFERQVDHLFSLFTDKILLMGITSLNALQALIN